MPKLGMEPIRRSALINATIAEVGEAGSLDVTVSQIAKRAGMSSALAHHYFGGKDQIFLAAMRHTLTLYGTQVQQELAKANGPKERLQAIVHAGFSGANFQKDVIAAWLNFYVLAQSSPDAQRLLNLYQNRLRSNLVYNLRPLIGEKAAPAAERIAGMIDGLYLRLALSKDPQASQKATDHVLVLIDFELKGHAQ